MTREHSDIRPNIPTTMWLGDTPCVPSAADPAACLKADCSNRPAAPATHHQHAAGIRYLNQLANLVASISVSDQPLRLQSP
jgi:hypothetical protein